MPSPYRTLASGAEIRAVSGHDRFVMCFTSADATGYTVDGAVAWRRPFRESEVLLAHGDPDAAAALVTAVAADTRPHRLSLPAPIMERVPEGLRPAKLERWRWFHCDAAPAEPVPGEERVGWLGEDDFTDIEELLDEAFPDSSARVTSAHVRRWFGVRGADGTLAGCGAVTGPGPDVPFLASVTVHPGSRRQGLGAAMTAWVTRTLLAGGHPFLALGSWDGAHDVHRLYRRLGYRDAHTIVSGAVEPEGKLRAISEP